MDLKLDSTHRASVAEEAREAMKRLRRLEKTPADPFYREVSRGQMAKDGKYPFPLRGIVKILDDPRGWLDRRKRKEDPCFVGFSQQQVASLSHWAETAGNEKTRKEMANGCRE